MFQWKLSFNSNSLQKIFLELQKSIEIWLIVYFHGRVIVQHLLDKRRPSPQHPGDEDNGSFFGDVHEITRCGPQQRVLYGQLGQ